MEYLANAAAALLIEIGNNNAPLADNIDGISELFTGGCIMTLSDCMIPKPESACTEVPV